MLKSSGYSASVWTYNFSICLWGEPSNPSFSWFLDFRTCPWAPKPFIFMFGETRIRWIIQEQGPNHCLENISLLDLELLDFENFENVGEDGRRTIRKSRLLFLEIREYGIDIFPKAWNWNFVIWDHWFFETLKFWNFGTRNLWNQETKKPRSVFIFN